MSARYGKAAWVLLLAGLCIAAGALLVSWLYRRGGQPSSEEEAFPLPAYSASRYLNTGTDALHVGIAVCAECHPNNHQSYLLTPHSQALSDLDAKAEPPDGSFFHKPSGRSYRVYRKDGQFRHEELLRTEEGKEMARVDLPIRYLIGSGHFTRSYLVEIDGFLHESPITWYTSKKKWDVSPGYDFPHHAGFERPVTAGCLVCHAGRVQPVAGSVHRMTLHEKAIGCENCHGPGSLHVERHRAKKHTAGTEDLTIVNPARLPRPQLEAICAFCHLNGPAKSFVRGRGVTDYRPGMPLTDYRIDYRFDSGDEQMTVVGHIEQLRRSACYQKSELTCISCHDPHARQKPTDSIAFYRQKCLDCHADHGCKLERAERLKKEPADNCCACHMPRGDTDIPHVAFTHHRIGLHTKPRSVETTRVPELVPTDNLSRLSLLDQQRNLALAYLDAFRNPVYSRYAGVFAERARDLLEGVQREGLRDGEVVEVLAHLWWKQKDYVRAGEYARQALRAKDLSTEGRSLALFVLALCEIHDRSFQSASGLLEDLVHMRRFAEDWRILGKCYLDLAQPRKALPALEQALAIRPYRHTTHLDLAEAYRLLGDTARADEHMAKARWLFDHRQD